MTEILTEYAEWNVIAHENNNMFRDIHLLEDILGSPKSLDSIHITRRSPKIENIILLHAWNFCKQANYFQRATSEFEALLVALKHNSIQLQHLTHDQLPVTFFRMGHQNMKQLIRPLEGLQTLHLTFDATVPPQKVFWNGLGTYWGIPSLHLPNVQDISVTYILLFNSIPAMSVANILVNLRQISTVPSAFKRSSIWVLSCLRSTSKRQILAILRRSSHCLVRSTLEILG